MVGVPEPKVEEGSWVLESVIVEVGLVVGFGQDMAISSYKVFFLAWDSLLNFIQSYISFYFTFCLSIFND